MSKRQTRSQTPSQTIGPFFHDAMFRGGESLLTNNETKGQRIRVEGQLLDGAGNGVSDALIEIWQANAEGRYAHTADDQAKALDASFSGYGRAASDREGRFQFDTIKPGPVPGLGNSLQAPHLNVTVFARGMLNHVLTRLYFADEDSNAADPVLNALGSAEDRAGLIATASDRSGVPVYSLDIHLQGEKETVFFD